MPNWLQRLETAWSRRYVKKNSGAGAQAGRKAVCVITGGTEGIGRCLAAEFAAAGHRIMLVARTDERLDSVAAELRRDFQVDIFTAPIDLCEPDAAQRIRRCLGENQLYADILVNNAAFGLGGNFTGQSPERLRDLCVLNMQAVTELTRAFLPEMLERARGGILNIASIGGLFPGPYMAAYYASKAYVLSLTEAIAHENAGRGVRISAAAPGPVATRFHRLMGTQDALYLNLQQVMPPDRVARIIFSGFMGRRTVIVPGLIASLSSFAVRYIPHVIFVPFIGWFLRQRC